MTEQDLLSYLRDAAQGASNSAASTVSGPVDLLAWLLNKGGIPVQNPVLGSNWMAQKGLTAKPANALAGMAGETLGNISPIVAAAKAPQIANALLRAEQSIAPTVANMAERYMVKQGMIQPATVWHGSPHKFDKFDAAHIGKGEGAQAYGHGLYLADSPDVARTYSSGSAPTVRQQVMPDGRVRIVDVQVPSGNLYKVDLHDSAIARMLDWDKPLSQQAPEVRQALSDLLDKYKTNPPNFADLKARAAKEGLTFKTSDDGFTGMLVNKDGQTVAFNSGRDSITGEEAYRGLGKWVDAANELRQRGIPGIRSLAGGSRGAGQGTSNYVVFPGEENMLRILERNGVPIGK